MEKQKIEFDYSLLIGLISTKVGTRKKFAKKLNMTEKTLANKLNNKSYFDQGEMVKARAIFEKYSINELFFCTNGSATER